MNLNTLKKTIYKNIKILDAASGVGCECIELSKEGYSITYNEPDRNLFELFINRMVREGKARSNSNMRDTYFELLTFENDSNHDKHTLEAYNLPWSNLKYNISQEHKFQIVLVLGNHISHVDNLDDLKNGLKDIKEIMTNDATLIIDHRNFTKIKNNLENTKNNKFSDSYIKNYHGNYMYCSDKSNGFILTPIKYNDKHVKLKYKDMRKNLWLNADINMLHLNVKEFTKILKEEGFNFPEIYGSDNLEKPIIRNDKELDMFKEDNNNDFFIYVTDRN